MESLNIKNGDICYSRIENIEFKTQTSCASNNKSSSSFQKNASFRQFLKAELTRGYQLENDKEQFSARREKIYSCIKILKEVEKFMTYGFFQCADSFLFVYTFLPLRFVMALWAIVMRPLRFCLKKRNIKKQNTRFLRSAEICDLLKGLILIICWIITLKIDTSMMYHLVKSQSIIKLYIFYNMLEVGDRLFSSFGQDAIDALLWTATEQKSKSYSIKAQYFKTSLHFIFALGYVLSHSILVLFQATTLNVAINSSNKALLTIMMSNNFVELKGSVFKKFDKNNFFQLSCSDVRERFHLTILLLAVTLQTMKEYAWHIDRLAILLPDCILLLLAEVLIDWVKHAFITRFNELNSSVYKEYTISLAYDMAQTRQETAFSDPSDLIARRMSFIPLPLGVAIARVLTTTLTSLTKPTNILLLFIVYLILVTMRILISLIILGHTCNYINIHFQSNLMSAQNADEKTIKFSNVKNISMDNKDITTSKFADKYMTLNGVFLTDVFSKSEEQKRKNFKNKHFQSDSNLIYSKNFVRAGSEPILYQ